VSSEDLGRREVRERDARDARFFAWDVPGDAHIVALVHEVGDAERSATVADAIATSVARRREHTLLLSAEPGPSPLDELLEATSSEGLPAALHRRARLTEVAVQRGDRPFVYLPGGSDAVAMRALLEDEVLSTFVERVRERGGTLFIVLSGETLLVDGLRALIDGYVALGDVSLPNVVGLPEFGRVRFESPDGGDEVPASDGDGSFELVEDASTGSPPESEESWKRRRATPTVPFSRIAVGVGGLLGVLAIWWFVLGGWPGGRGVAGERSGTVETASPAAVSRPTSPPTFDKDIALAAFAEAPELAYSVQVASFPARTDAEARIAKLRESRAGFYFIAPTPVRGRVYRRIFAGALERREEADSLMQVLVTAGEKAETVRWDVRPTRLAFDLGVYPSREKADDRVEELAVLEIPAYTLWASSRGEEV